MALHTTVRQGALHTMVGQGALYTTVGQGVLHTTLGEGSIAHDSEAEYGTRRKERGLCTLELGGG